MEAREYQKGQTMGPMAENAKMMQGETAGKWGPSLD
jgi:hypothetical protein